MKSNLKRTGFIFSCVAPAVILFAVFMVAPTFNVFRLSLYQRSTFNFTIPFSSTRGLILDTFPWQSRTVAE